MDAVAGQFPSALGDLRSQGTGHTYAWLPADESASYQSIELPVLAATRFPRLRCPPVEIKAATRGRKRLEHGQCGRIAVTAALVDGAGLSRKRVELLLYAHPDDDKDWSRALLEPNDVVATGDERERREAKRKRWEQARAAAKTSVRTHLHAGRRLLQARRVLPWALWDDGDLPAEWWLTDRFEEAIGWWREDSARSAAEARVAVWARLRAEHRALEEAVAWRKAPALKAAPRNIFTMVLDPPWLALAAGYHERAEARIQSLRAQPWSFPT
jgi:hypothetical protein